MNLGHVAVFDGRTFGGTFDLGTDDGRISSLHPATGKARATVLPGFIDCHVHLALFELASVLRGGVTTARDLGWRLQSLEALAKICEREDGPSLVYAGQILTARGGYPSQASWAPAGTAREVLDIEDARSAVREMHAFGASVIKVAQEPREGPTLEMDFLRAICEEAHGIGLRVTSHCGSLRELQTALDAEVDELAHGLWSDEWIPDDVLAAMVSANMTVVPTLHIDPSDVRIQNTRRFIEAGGRVVYGTDMGNPPVPGGIDTEELRLLGEAGMSLEQVLAAATSRAAEHLGLPDRGRIAEGKRADLIVVDGDPREDLFMLTKPYLVLKNGQPVT